MLIKYSISSNEYFYQSDGESCQVGLTFIFQATKIHQPRTYHDLIGMMKYDFSEFICTFTNLVLN